MKRLTFGLAGLFVVLQAGAAHATSYNITTNAMTIAVDGACSLVEAIAASNTLTAKNECFAGTGNDDITLSGGTYSATAPLQINRTVSIHGMGTTIIAAKFNGVPSATELIIVGNANANLTLDNVTLRNDTTEANHNVSGVYAHSDAYFTSNERLRVTGFTWSGIYAVNATVSLTHALIDHNSNRVGSGGGIYRFDSNGAGNHGFVFDHSSAIYNTALNDGGGIYFGGDGGSHFYYSTFAQNTAKRGAGLFIDTQTGGYFEGWHMTVGRNNATVSGGGIYEDHGGSELNISSSIVSNNTVNNNATAATANLFRQAQAGYSEDTIWGAGVTANSLGCGGVANWVCNHNLYGTDAKLAAAPMAMGGVYQYMEVLMPLKGSPAIDFGTTVGNQDYDQRGLPANIDGDGNGSVARDAGAVERNQIWQSEDTLQWVASAGDFVNIDAGYPAPQLGRLLSANATNDYVTYPIPIAEAGDYEIVVKFKQASNGGKFKVGTASSSGGVYDETNFAEQTSYAASTSYPAAVNLGTRTFATAGKYWFRFRVTAAGAGGGRNLYQDYIKVRKTN